MKFEGKFKTTPICGSYCNSDTFVADIDEFICILEQVSKRVGDETRTRLQNAIKKPLHTHPTDGRISFCDTPIFGDFYVYLWFDSLGELFYIGKGRGGRVNDLQGRSADFKEKAAGGCYKILSSDMDEGYALDLEKILLFECALQERDLVNRRYGDAVDAIKYCNERDLLLWYWDHLGVVSRFSELTGFNVFYDTKGVRAASDYSNSSVFDERALWWKYTNIHPDTNNPKRLAEIQAEEEKKLKQKERAKEYRQRRRERQRNVGVMA